MLDVHPPQHTPHGWRDFFIHIATIVIGLLIAVGLEQTVEAIHRHHERAELRESLRTETEEIFKDATDTENRKLIHIAWLDRRIAQVKSALQQQQPLPPPEALQYPPYQFADDPIWRAAKVSGQAALLPPEEVNAYSEVELTTSGVAVSHAEEENTRGKLHSFEDSLPTGPGGVTDWAHLSPADLRTYLGLLNDNRQAVQLYRNWTLRALATEDCIRRGDWKLRDIFATEARFVAAAHIVDEPPVRHS
jgi:hypothetical protein